MTVVERKKELKRKITCVSICACVQLIWIVPVGLKAHIDNANIPETEVVSEQTQEIESVIIENVENDIVKQPSESEVPEETESETEVDTKTEPLYYCEWLDVYFNQEDFDLLCRTTYCESGNQTYDTQVMVCLVILNRYYAGYSDTIHGVVYQKGAFAVTNWKDFEQRLWNEKTEQAVIEALKENNHPRDMYYFRTGHYHKWAVNYMKSDRMYFSTKN